MEFDSKISVPIPLKLNQAATLSWIYLNKLSTFSTELFQPKLSDAGNLGIDLKTENGWALFTIVRQLKIPENSMHYRYNGFYLLKRYDENGEIYYIIVDLLPNTAWELIPFISTVEQIDEVNSRRNLFTNQANFVKTCDVADLSGENIDLILQECEPSDIQVSGTIQEVAEILGHQPVFPDDIQIIAPDQLRTNNGPLVPQPVRVAAGSPPRTSTAAEKARMTNEDEIITVTPKLKTKRDTQRPKHLSDFVVEYPGGNLPSILKPRDNALDVIMTI